MAIAQMEPTWEENPFSQQTEAPRILNIATKGQSQSLPPHNREAEDAVLGDCLSDVQACAFALHALRDDDFYCNRIGFEAVRESFEKCGRADLMLVMNYLKRVSPGIERDGTGPIVTAWRALAAPMSVEEHCKAVKEFATKRTLWMLEKHLEHNKLDVDQKKIEFLEEITTRLRENSIVSVDGYAELFEELRRICGGELRDLGFPGCRIMARTCCMTPHSITILCGNPGASKSLFIMELLWRWSLAGHRVSSLNLEKKPAFHGRRLLAQMAACEGMTRNNWCYENAALVAQVLQAQEVPLQRIYSERVFQTPGNVLPTRSFIVRWIRQEIARGSRIILIDPITIMALESNQRFRDEEKLFLDLSQLVNKHAVSLILVTHPKNTVGHETRPSMENISGSASFSRFTDTVLWLSSHESTFTDLKETGSPIPLASTSHNRTMHLLKTKLGPGEGQKIAFNFEIQSLTHRELGIIPEGD